MTVTGVQTCALPISGTPDRDTHLRSDDFFAVDTHPTLTFTSSRVVKTGDDSYDVVGVLTIRGVAREITLPVTYLGTAKDPWGNVRSEERRVGNDCDWSSDVCSSDLRHPGSRHAPAVRRFLCGRYPSHAHVYKLTGRQDGRRQLRRGRRVDDSRRCQGDHAAGHVPWHGQGSVGQCEIGRASCRE